ncbi:unnamed protein product [Polarella glacialis]|uniref:Tryptophan synthase beta chain-like PALP domain-containing protein n=1 Tax=Polarella glacialis TaxID=89957 RepID=A0A813KLP7_POLGL|nr:unnamed protein product [Polarella glacialis]CAE8704617.1 unnamed protein product [Polarella glacialis]
MAMLSVVRYTPPSWARAAFRTVPSERVRLTSACAERPTPVFPMRNLPGLPEGVELFVKRDDYTGVELSGNKVRKLEFIFADALKMGADCVVTCGGAQSNHARATAIAARMLGLEPFLVLRLEEPHVSEATAEAIAADPPLVGNLLVDRLAGAQLRFVTKSEYSKHGSESLIQGLCNELQSQGRRPFAVPVGGSSGLGCWGYLEAVAEMRKQDVDESLGITDVAFACGSGGTAAGLALGNHLSGWGVGVHAYSVCDSPEYFHDFIDKVALPEMSLRPEAGVPPSRQLLRVENVKNLGYAVASDEELRFYALVARSTGLVLDPCYTGKAFYRLYRELQSCPEKFKGRRVLYVHTGGMLGTFHAASTGQFHAALPPNESVRYSSIPARL